MFARPIPTTATHRDGAGSGAAGREPASRPTDRRDAPETDRRWSEPIPFPQMELPIGRTDDAAELEADRMAEGVLAGTAAQLARPSGGPSSGQSAGLVLAGVLSGLTSPGRPLDGAVRASMERSFGHDFGDVRVHTDDPTAAAAVGALAYTVGRDIVTGPDQYAPDTTNGRHLLAHELAHVVQGRGRAGIVRRYTAYTAADQAAKKSGGWTHPASKPMRVSDDGQMVVEDNGWGANLSKRAWTTPAIMASSNSILTAQGSRAKLSSKGGTLSGVPPANATAATVSLEEIEPVKASGSGPFDLESDCGSACKQVMGSGPAGNDVAVLKGGGKERYTAARDYYGADASHAHTTPEDWAEEVFKKEFGAALSRADAYKKYAALDPAAKQAFDQKYGINLFAKPSVGQGLTVSSEQDMPGYHTVSSFTWNFHYAAVVATSGSDHMTLENAAGWKVTDWIFYMYGPASKSQTFHEFHGATGTHGSAYTTLVVEPETRLHVKVTRADAAALMPDGSLRKLAVGTSLRIVEQFRDAGLDWLRVEVKSGPLTGTKMTIQKAFTR